MHFQNNIHGFLFSLVNFGNVKTLKNNGCRGNYRILATINIVPYCLQ